MRDAGLLRVFPRADRERGREALDVAADSHVERLGVLGYAVRRRLRLGSGQQLGEALAWAAAPGVLLAGVLAGGAFVLGEWAPWNSRAGALRTFGPFLTTGVLVYPLYAAAVVAVLAGCRLAIARTCVALAYAASVGTHIASQVTGQVTTPPSGTTLGHPYPAPPFVLLAVLGLLCVPVLVGPRPHLPAWHRSTLLFLGAGEAAVLVAIHHADFITHNNRYAFMDNDLAELGIRFYVYALPVLVIIALLVLTGRRPAARGVAVLLAPWTVLVGMSYGYEGLPDPTLLTWAIGTLALCGLTVAIPPDRARTTPTTA